MNNAPACDPWTLHRWRKLVHAQLGSGLSVPAFCRRERIAVPTFYAWKRRVLAFEAGLQAAALAAQPGNGPVLLPGPGQRSGSRSRTGAEPGGADLFLEVMSGEGSAVATLDDSVPRRDPGDSAGTTIEVVTACGITIRVREGFDPALLRRVLEALP